MIKFVDGFDHYACDTNTAYANFMSLKWTNNIVGTGFNISPAWGRSLGGQGLQLTSNTHGVYKTVSAGVATLITGCAVYFVATPTNNAFIQFFDGTTEQISLRGDGSGHLTISRNGTVLATSTNTVSVNTWYFIEIKATIHPSAGVIEVRVNGTSTGWIPSTASLNTRNTANSQATGIAVVQPNQNVRIDDFYIADTTGSVNNDFLGPIQIAVQAPSAAGNYAQWTPNYGANFGNVRDTIPDGDQTYNASSTANNIDSFVFEKNFMSAGTVLGIQHCILAKQDVGAQRVIAPFQRSSSTDYPGTSVNLGGGYNYILEVKDTNPDTSAAWTLAGLNAAEFGVKLIS